MHVFFCSSDILSGPEMPEHNISFISLKTRIIELLLKALMIDNDSANTQMLLGRYKVSRIIRKPDFHLCENKGTDQLCSNCTADQCLCFRYTDSTITLLRKTQISSF